MKKVLEVMTISTNNPNIICNREMHFEIPCNNIQDAGTLSVSIKRMLKQINVDKTIIRRVSVACYEAEINVVIHSHGGIGKVNFEDDFLEITFVDKGPGIPDIDLAMEKGFSTASEHARLNGFGAGMGLPNIKDASDEFDLKSSPCGTELTIGFHLGVMVM